MPVLSDSNTLYSRDLRVNPRFWVVSCALVALITISGLLVTPFRVSSESMANTLEAGDVVLIGHSGLLGRFWRPQRGQIVVLRSPINEDTLVIKRIVAIPRDTFSLREGKLILNGKVQQEPYVTQEWRGDWPRRLTVSSPRAIMVPDQHYFVLSDNRIQTFDSRSWGSVPGSALLGTVVMILPRVKTRHFFAEYLSLAP